MKKFVLCSITLSKHCPRGVMCVLVRSSSTICKSQAGLFVLIWREQPVPKYESTQDLPNAVVVPRGAIAARLSIWLECELLLHPTEVDYKVIIVHACRVGDARHIGRPALRGHERGRNPQL